MPSSHALIYLCQLPVGEAASQLSGEDHDGGLAARGSKAAAQREEGQDHRLSGTHGEGSRVWLQQPR